MLQGCTGNSAESDTERTLGCSSKNTQSAPGLYKRGFFTPHATGRHTQMSNGATIWLRKFTYKCTSSTFLRISRRRIFSRPKLFQPISRIPDSVFSKQHNTHHIDDKKQNRQWCNNSFRYGSLTGYTITVLSASTILELPRSCSTFSHCQVFLEEPFLVHDSKPTPSWTLFSLNILLNDFEKPH